MYENYILYPNAITYVINKELQNARILAEEDKLEQKHINQWLEEDFTNRNYLSNEVKPEKYHDEEWIYQKNHASHILEDLFQEYQI
ncbi:hypothetical protein [Trichormus azollae]|jgi:hypothetical protein|uniref:Uncharacterized protein n=1 Tax=Nostoc azollae (strain 0708) TaxID=551115 RepID=D7DZP0_NOSA0|nr:hypothetical protein [Trichormus azollae]ADI64522.1 hypothetical protein Aazo_2636 ['Nostoc azollae' 0708]